MSKALHYSILIACAALVWAQQNDPSNKPNVFLENKAKPPKESNSRTIQGTVKDPSDNPVRGAIVQLKDMKTSKVVAFPTKDDGKFIFRDLFMDVDYELTAQQGELTAPAKKVSPYDTRKNVILTFRLEPPKKPQ